MFSLQRHLIKNSALSPWIKFIWYFTADHADIHNKLLPADGIDLILNLADPMTYETDDTRIAAPKFHINGLRSKPSYIHQCGTVRTYGIAFYAYGLSPFINGSLADISDRIVDVTNVSGPLLHALNTALETATEAPDAVCEALEHELASILRITPQQYNNAGLIRDFMASADTTSIQNFCALHQINQKTFERMVRRCTGYTPKILYRIGRFQTAANQLVHDHDSAITDVVYDNHYSDQPYFTREFQQFTGAAPRTFLKRKETIKENVTYTYR